MENLKQEITTNKTTEILSLKDAVYCNKEKTKFDVTLTTKTYGIIPYTYECSGIDDETSDISKELSKLYRDGAIQIADCKEDITQTLLETEIRLKRNQLLMECDYFMLPDYPASDEDKNKVKFYRQTLRDLTKQLGFPQDVSFPEKPDCLK